VPRQPPGFSSDLVYVDTDAVCLGGYFFCISRTLLCGDFAPTRAQREAYRASHDWMEVMKDLVRPGVTCRELAERGPRLPDRYLPQRYECMIHGIGLEEESPSVAFREIHNPIPTGAWRKAWPLWSRSTPARSAVVTG
jgi:Xaa-Pro aminopeptidase